MPRIKKIDFMRTLNRVIQNFSDPTRLTVTNVELEAKIQAQLGALSRLKELKLQYSYPMKTIRGLLTHFFGAQDDLSFEERFLFTMEHGTPFAALAQELNCGQVPQTHYVGHQYTVPQAYARLWRSIIKGLTPDEWHGTHYFESRDQGLSGSMTTAAAEGPLERGGIQSARRASSVSVVSKRSRKPQPDLRASAALAVIPSVEDGVQSLDVLALQEQDLAERVMQAVRGDTGKARDLLPYLPELLDPSGSSYTQETQRLSRELKREVAAVLAAQFVRDLATLKGTIYDRFLPTFKLQPYAGLSANEVAALLKRQEPKPSLFTVDALVSELDGIWQHEMLSSKTGLCLERRAQRIEGLTSLISFLRILAFRGWSHVGADEMRVLLLGPDFVPSREIGNGRTKSGKEIVQELQGFPAILGPRSSDLLAAKREEFETAVSRDGIDQIEKQLYELGLELLDAHARYQQPWAGKSLEAPLSQVTEEDRGHIPSRFLRSIPDDQGWMVACCIHNREEMRYLTEHGGLFERMLLDLMSHLEDRVIAAHVDCQYIQLRMSVQDYQEWLLSLRQEILQLIREEYMLGDSLIHFRVIGQDPPVLGTFDLTSQTFDNDTLYEAARRRVVQERDALVLAQVELKLGHARIRLQAVLSAVEAHHFESERATGAKRQALQYLYRVLGIETGGTVLPVRLTLAFTEDQRVELLKFAGSDPYYIDVLRRLHECGMRLVAAPQRIEGSPAKQSARGPVDPGAMELQLFHPPVDLAMRPVGEVVHFNKFARLVQQIKAIVKFYQDSTQPERKAGNLFVRYLTGPHAEKNYQVRAAEIREYLKVSAKFLAIRGRVAAITECLGELWNIYEHAISRGTSVLHQSMLKSVIKPLADLAQELQLITDHPACSKHLRQVAAPRSSSLFSLPFGRRAGYEPLTESRDIQSDVKEDQRALFDSTSGYQSGSAGATQDQTRHTQVHTAVFDF